MLLLTSLICDIIGKRCRALSDLSDSRIASVRTVSSTRSSPDRRLIVSFLLVFLWLVLPLLLTKDRYCLNTDMARGVTDTSRGSGLVGSSLWKSAAPSVMFLSSFISAEPMFLAAELLSIGYLISRGEGIRSFWCCWSAIGVDISEPNEDSGD